MSLPTLRSRRTRTETDQFTTATDAEPASVMPGPSPSPDACLARMETDLAVPTATDVRPAPGVPGPAPSPACSAIGDVRWRHSVRVSGRVRSVRVQPWADVPTLEMHPCG